ncbi:MAG: tetratricopeptide repeat protein, partial [Methylobacter sp.]
IWFRLGNLGLHLALVVTLFLFLRRLFERVLPESNQTLSPHWLAFFAALIFAMHPVSVYAVAYLVQRSTLMATLFAVLTWRLFLEGIIRKNSRWLLASSITYFFAVFSKEHAVMVPLVTVALLLLVDSQSNRQRFMLVWPTFVLYGLVGGFVVFQVKSTHMLGQAYEPIAENFITLLGPDFNARLVYPCSILTQSFLFFKYLWLWIVPSPAWMSVDMPQNFVRSLWSWPEAAGFIGFLFYPLIAVRLLLQRGVKGLLGFAMLCPWMLFATELSTVRIQESFVLYRSYLWMAGAFAALPFLCQKLNAKHAVIALTFIALSMMPLSWLRLTTFSHSLLLWDDAARLIENTESKHLGTSRIYYNRGTELTKIKHYDEAIADLSKAIKIKSNYDVHVYNNRAVAYLESRQYGLALNDINKVIELDPNKAQVYIGKAQALQGLNDAVGAMEAYKKACLLGISNACKKAEQSVPSSTEFVLHP